MDITQLLKDLQADLADIERQMDDKTLSHSDQHMLDQAWEDIVNQIDALEESYEAWQAYMDGQEEPVTIAPPPPIHVSNQVNLTEDEFVEEDLEDDRPDCSRCAGCAYCEESAPGYDGTDEI